MQNQPPLILFGGSFNPVHLGHRAAVEAVLNEFKAINQTVELRLLPAYQSVEKASPVAVHHRLAMLKLAFEDMPNIVIDTYETDLNKAQQTYTTVGFFKDFLAKQQKLAKTPHRALIFMLGFDQLKNIHTWNDYQKLLNKCHIIAVSRDETLLSTHSLKQYETNNLATLSNTPNGSVYLCKMPLCHFSSSAVRKTMEKTQLNPKVWHYIQQHQLYI